MREQKNFGRKDWFRIETTGPYRSKSKGTILTGRGKSYVRRADCYSIRVVIGDTALFYDHVGLTIERKKSRLERHLCYRKI